MPKTAGTSVLESTVKGVAKKRRRGGLALREPTARSRITNGRELLPGVNGNDPWVRRFHDLNALHISDLGGSDTASNAEKALVRRAACLIVECERMEVQFAAEGEAPQRQLETYQRCVNTLRRTLQTLGLERRAKEVPDLAAYLAQRYGKREGTEAS